LALAGPLAGLLVGFGCKKTDRFLNLEFTDDTGTSLGAVFGKGPGSDIQTVYSRIVERKQNRLRSLPNKPDKEDVAARKPSADSAGTDVVAQIEKLARLRDQKLLTEEEFQAKKRELLNRL